MKEGCVIKIEGAGYGIVMSSDECKLFGGRIGKPKVDICPECGEVSIYVENLDKLKQIPIHQKEKPHYFHTFLP